MNLKQKLRGIFSLSAAALALLQGTDAARAKELELLMARGKDDLKDQETSTRDKLILAPGANKDELLQKYAAHRSHASHSSHSSHYSGTGYSTYSRPSYAPSDSAPSRPAYPPARSVSTPTNPPQVTVYPPSVKSDPDELTRKLIASQKERAARGQPTAQYDLGVRYLEGKGVGKDEQKGVEYLEFAAQQGHYSAIERLKLFTTNSPLPKGAVSAGRPTSTNAEPVLLESPEPPRKNYAVLSKEAAEGSSLSQYELALRYFTGDGVETNEHRANTLLEMSAAQGYGKALLRLEQTQKTQRE